MSRPDAGTVDALAFLVLVAASELVLARLSFDTQVPGDVAAGLLGTVAVGLGPWWLSQRIEGPRRHAWGGLILGGLLGAIVGRSAATWVTDAARVFLPIGSAAAIGAVAAAWGLRERRSVPPRAAVPIAFAVAATIGVAFAAGTQVQAQLDGAVHLGVRLPPFPWANAAVALVAWVAAAVAVSRPIGIGAVAIAAAALALAPRRDAAPVWDSDLPAARGPDLVLISVDTLRADHAASMAAVQRLAREGTTFADASATGPWTLPSVASVLTGLDPEEHGAFRGPQGAFSVLRDDVDTVAEALRARGWDTAAVVAPNAFLGRGFGFDQGFAHYDHVLERAAWAMPLSANDSVARPLVADVIGGLGLTGRRTFGSADELAAIAGRVARARRDRPLFLWIHFLDPHLPYRHVFDTDLPLRTRALFGGGDPQGAFPSGAFTAEQARTAYAWEVQVVDRALLRLLDDLGPPPVNGRVIALTSDHGEELLDHGGYEHGHTLYQELLHVPLVVTGPGFSPGAVVTDPVDLRDVAATLLGAAGIGAPPGARDLSGTVPPRRIRSWNLLYGEWLAQAGRIGALKAIDLRDGRPARVYDLAADPGETRDPGAGRPEVVSALIVPIDPSIGAAASLSGSEQRMLETLGYTQ